MLCTFTIKTVKNEPKFLPEIMDMYILPGEKISNHYI